MGPILVCGVDWQYLRERRAGASSHKVPMYSPGGATMFDFVVLYNGSKLRIEGVRDGDMRYHWSVECSVKYISLRLHCYRRHGVTIIMSYQTVITKCLHLKIKVKYTAYSGH